MAANITPVDLMAPLENGPGSSATSEESGSTLDSLDSAYDEEALEKLMGRYEQLSARFDTIEGERTGGRRGETDELRRDKAEDVPSATKRPTKRARRGGRRAGKGEPVSAGFEGRVP